MKVSKLSGFYGRRLDSLDRKVMEKYERKLVAMSDKGLQRELKKNEELRKKKVEQKYTDTFGPSVVAGAVVAGAAVISCVVAAATGDAKVGEAIGGVVVSAPMGFLAGAVTNFVMAHVESVRENKYYKKVRGQKLVPCKQEAVHAQISSRRQDAYVKSREAELEKRRKQEAALAKAVVKNKKGR